MPIANTQDKVQTRVARWLQSSREKLEGEHQNIGNNGIQQSKSGCASYVCSRGHKGSSEIEVSGGSEVAAEERTKSRLEEVESSCWGDLG